jgi:hypothetical protein
MTNINLLPAVENLDTTLITSDLLMAYTCSFLNKSYERITVEKQVVG